MICRICKQDKDLALFPKKHYGRCRLCENRRCSIRRAKRGKELRLKAIAYLGGRCQGGNCLLHQTDNQLLLDFHHRNPDQKKFNISDRLGRVGQRWELLQAELDKCDLLCVVCHRLMHSPD